MGKIKTSAVVTGVALLVSVPTGCFDQISKLPDPSETAGETTTAGDTTTTLGETAGHDSTMDVDQTETAGPETTESPSPYEGLLGCGSEQLCALWQLPDCGGGCSLGETGACVLDALAARGHGMVQLQDCPNCAHQVMLFRGASTPDVLVQDVTFEGGEPVSYGPITHCQLVEPAFFQACQAMPNADCLATSAWMADCVDVAELVCPKDQ